MSKQYPHDRLHAAIVKALDGSGFTTAGLGVLWSAETDDAPRTCEQRVRRLREGLPLQAVDIVNLMDAIGYDVVLKKR